jgi:hypothetical protein
MFTNNQHKNSANFLYIDHTIDKKMIAHDMSAVLTDLDLAITDAKKGRR